MNQRKKERQPKIESQKEGIRKRERERETSESKKESEDCWKEDACGHIGTRIAHSALLSFQAVVRNKTEVKWG